MASEICEDDSDSDSLPEVSVLFPTPSNEISNGDIVWAKFKKLYWPALVRHVYPKERKLTVWYTDDPGKNFKLLMKNVFLFHDSDMTSKIKKEVREHGLSVIKAHDGLTTHALTYLNRKVQGKIDNPLLFFDQTYPFFLIEDWLAKNPTDSREMFSDMKINPLYLNHEVSTSTSIRIRGSISEAAISDDSDVVATDDESDEGLSTTERKSASYGKSIHMTISESSDNEYINEIVTCILSGETDVYLSKVMSEKIVSVYYNFYLKAMECDKRNLDYISYGPVEDLNLLRKLTNYLLDLYDRISRKGKTRKIKTDVCYSSGNKMEDARFVSSVLLPESIIFAISHIKKVSLDEAKRLFHHKSDVKLKVGPLESIDESKKAHIIDGDKKVESDEFSQSHEVPSLTNFVFDVDTAGCSNKRSHLDLADVLEEIDENKCPKDFPSFSSESCSGISKGGRKSPKSAKIPTKSNNKSLKRGSKDFPISSSESCSVPEGSRKPYKSVKTSPKSGKKPLLDVAECSYKKSRLARADVLENIYEDKCHKDFPSSSSESCSDIAKGDRKPPKSDKKPTKSDNKSLKSGLKDFPISSSESCSVPEGSRKLSKSNKTSPKSGKKPLLDVAECSNKKSRLARADILENIYEDKCPKDFPSSSSENCSGVPKHIRKSSKSFKTPPKNCKKLSKSVEKSPKSVSKKLQPSSSERCSGVPKSGKTPLKRGRKPLKRNNKSPKSGSKDFPSSSPDSCNVPKRGRQPPESDRRLRKRI